MSNDLEEPIDISNPVAVKVLASLFVLWCIYRYGRHCGYTDLENSVESQRYKDDVFYATGLDERSQRAQDLKISNLKEQLLKLRIKKLESSDGADGIAGHDEEIYRW